LGAQVKAFRDERSARSAASSAPAPAAAWEAAKEKGNALLKAAQYTEAAGAYSQALALAEEAGEAKAAAIILSNRSCANLHLGQPRAAERDAKLATVRHGARDRASPSFWGGPVWG
jgi:hypothetical protein